MKTSNVGVCHEFTSNNPRLDTQSGSMSLGKDYRDGHTDTICIYSYSTIIATRNMNTHVYKMSQRTYSNTTSKQQGLLVQAIGGQIISVYDVNNSDLENLETMISDLEDHAQRHVRARKTSYESVIKRTINNMVNFLNIIKIDKRSSLYKRAMKIINTSKLSDFNELVAVLLNLSEEAKAEAVKADKKRLKALKLKNQEEISTVNNQRLNAILATRKEAFNNFDSSNTEHQGAEGEYFKMANIIKKYKLETFEWFLHHKDLLRITGKCTVITSQHVTFSKAEAINLYRALRANAIKVGQKVLIWRCLAVTPDYLTVGCHTIAITDIEEQYKILTSCKDTL